MTTKRNREYINEARKLGVIVKEVTTTGGNHQWLVLTLRGKNKKFLIPSSPSDRRAFLNWRSDVKKWLKEFSNDK